MPSVGASSRVSTLELFFDLVFVFTITQVAFIVEADPSWRSCAQAFLELLVIFWMYGGFAWLTNQLGSESTRQRIVVLLGMAAFLITSLAVPRAFGEDALAFALAYLVLNLVHLGGFLLRGTGTFTTMVRIGRTNLLAAALILVAAIVGGWWHWPLWTAAVLVQFLPQLPTRRIGDFDIGVDHFAERHELMIIIVLGESLVSVALAAQQQRVDLSLVIGTLCGLAASAALWFAYFDGESTAAAEALRQRPDSQRAWYGLFGYDAPHVLMMSGIIAIAAGSRLSLPDLVATTSTAAAALIGGGAAVYLLGLSAFRALLHFRTPVSRLVGAVAMAAAIPVGTSLGAAQELVVIAVLIGVLLVLERARSARLTPV